MQILHISRRSVHFLVAFRAALLLPPGGFVDKCFTDNEIIMHEVGTTSDGIKIHTTLRVNHPLSGRSAEIRGWRKFLNEEHYNQYSTTNTNRVIK
jgi:hypothetical protein